MPVNSLQNYTDFPSKSTDVNVNKQSGPELCVKSERFMWMANDSSGSHRLYIWYKDIHEHTLRDISTVH